MFVSPASGLRGLHILLPPLQTSVDRRRTACQDEALVNRLCDDFIAHSHSLPIYKPLALDGEAALAKYNRGSNE